MKTEVVKLSSGWFAVFIDGEWIDAASKTEEQAKTKLERFLSSMSFGMIREHARQFTM